MDAQTELQNVSSRNSSLSNLSNALYVIGVIAIIAGVITFIVGINYADSWNDAKRLVSSSYKTIGIGSVISGFCFFFFGAIGKAVNEIRNYTITDFNLRHEIKTEAASTSKEINNPKQASAETESVDDLNIGDKVKLISNGKLFEVVGLVENGFIQCKPINKDLIDKFFDNYTSFKRSQLEKVEE